MSRAHEVAYAAVSEQLQPRWTVMSATSFDKPEEVRAKAEALKVMRRWISGIQDRSLRKAYERWWEAADYTVRRYMEEHAIKQEATSVGLPEVPNFYAAD